MFFIQKDNIFQSFSNKVPKCQNDTLGCALEEIAVLI